MDKLHKEKPYAPRSRLDWLKLRRTLGTICAERKAEIQLAATGATEPTPITIPLPRPPLLATLELVKETS